MSGRKRTYLSGSKKRSKKQKFVSDVKKMQGSMQQYLLKSDEDYFESPMPEEIETNESAEEKSDSVCDDDVSVKSEENDYEKNVVDDTNVMSASTENVNLDTKNNVVQSFPKDVGLWPAVIPNEFREYFTVNKPCQYISEIHNSSKFCYDKIRFLTEHNFYRIKQNKQKINREWLVYSPSKKAVYCYVCKLFSSSKQSLCDEGFSNWKNITERLSEHENSSTHRDSICKLSLRAEKCSRIDYEIINEYNKECNYWRSVLTRVVAVVKFLAERGLPIFGDNETIGSLQNGNFLGCVELLAKFDPFISDHLEKCANKGRGSVNYLSSTIVTEILQLMSKTVLNHLLMEVREAKYFGLIIDSSPDISHTDQLSIVLRYVNKEGVPVERFIKFLSIYSHDALSLSTAVLNELQCLNLDILNCRGQSYDNASNMAGRYSGLQARIKAISPLAIYVPCSAHSLNLVGSNAVQCCHQAVSFFGVVQNIYNFFSASTHRWNLLQQQLKNENHKLTAKPLSNTRWSAEADATSALRKGYKLIRKLLHDISVNENEESPTTCHEAGSLYSKMCKLETALMIIIWDTILQCLNKVNKSFQYCSSNISTVVPLYVSLIDFMQSVRENFDKYEKMAKELVEPEVTYCNLRKRTLSKRIDNSDNHVNLCGRESFKVTCHYVICDALIAQLHKRKECYVSIEERFGFLYSSDKDEKEIKECAEQFQKIFLNDIDENFHDELKHFKSFFKNHSSPEDSLKRIKSLQLSHTFPNVESALSILLTMPISNCSSERSFSVLKRIKNHLRSCLSQENLQAFSLLTIENSVTSKLDFKDLIDDFASQKSRKKPF